MSQCRWTFYDPIQGTQTLGLYHGDESGHVMIYLNEQVVLIDFMVHQSKSYSIMVNQAMVKLNLNKSGTGFNYQFEGKRVDAAPSTYVRLKRLFSGAFS